MVEKAGGPNNKETASSLGADETKIKRGFKALIKEGKKARLPDENVVKNAGGFDEKQMEKAVGSKEMGVKKAVGSDEKKVKKAGQPDAEKVDNA